MAECDICMTKKPKWTCPCTAAFCYDCMTLQNKPECSACQKVWSSDDPINTKFKKIVKAQSVEKLKLRELKALSAAQLYVDWMIEVEGIQKNFRFGILKPLPKKPKLSFEVQEGESFPCPKEDCRGFVTAKESTALLAMMTLEELYEMNRSSCGTCKDAVCLRCRELSRPHHKCDEKTVQSIAELRNSCKMCPRCNAMIFKTMGCDHMFCTHCRNHFSWKTNMPLANNRSTNGHYNHTEAFAKNISMNEGDPEWLKKSSPAEVNVPCRQAEDLLHNPGSDRTMLFTSEFPRKLWKKIFSEDLTCIRYLHKSRYVPWFQKYMDTLIEYRCKYLRKQIDETTFYDKVSALEDLNVRMTFEKEIVETVIHVACDIFHQAVLSTGPVDIFINQFIDFLGPLSKMKLGKLVVYLPTLVDPLPFLRLL